MHLERLLVATLFAMFVSTTVALLAAANNIAAENESMRIADDWFFVGAAAAYAILSGYYYFMLMQNYAVIVSLMEIDQGLAHKIHPLWEFFKPDRASVAGLVHQFNLIQATTLPLLITVFSLLGIRLLLNEEKEIYFWACIIFQVFLYFMTMWAPFQKFVRALRKFAA